MGGQEHFYLEPIGCLAIPKGEKGEMVIFSTTQDVNWTQISAAKVLGVDANKIVASVKRIGTDICVVFVVVYTPSLK